MQVILRKDVKHLGLAGDVVSVKTGYARHWLLPKKWAVPFTKARASEVAHRQQWITAQQKKAQKQRQTWLEKVQGTQLTFVKEADASGHLFGSVSPNDIIGELAKQGYEVDKKWVQLTSPIKQTGEHPLVLTVDKQMSAKITVLISPAVSKTAKKHKPKKRLAQFIKSVKAVAVSSKESSTENISSDTSPLEEKSAQALKMTSSEKESQKPVKKSEPKK